MSVNNIQMVDLKKQYLKIKDEINEAIYDVLKKDLELRKQDLVLKLYII